MGDMKYGCPLCCSQLFNSKQALLDHLSSIISNLQCPICHNKCSVAHILEHLRLDSGQLNDSNNVHVPADKRTETQNEDQNKSRKMSVEISDPPESENAVQNLEAAESNDINKMYVELLNKQMLKPDVGMPDVKLVKEDGGTRYVILTNDDTDLTIGNTIVSKQNNDGTVSFTSIQDMKVETEEYELSAENPIETEESQEEVYSCNTCGVSFTSVLDHIQNYHGDQEVVVEEPLNLDEQENEPTNEQCETSVVETVVAEKQQSRRVITETGDIVVEVPKIVKVPQVNNQSSKKDSEKDGQPSSKRYVQVEQLCDSLVKDITPVDEKSGPYHKVIVKEVETQEGVKMKILHCLACGIYVSSLNEFKSYPCKVFKYSCAQCPVSYENSKSLCAHMKVHKTKDNVSVPVTYECTVCCTIFPTNKSLKLHKRMHDPIKTRPIQPPVENTDGSEVSGRRFKCNICDKMIPIDYKAIHQNSHKTNNKMNCSICNKKFSSLEYLEMHINVHNLDKVPKDNQDKSLPYNCVFCNRRFARPHEKVKHERIHTGEKPHSCEICGKSFRVSYCLTLHMRTHTGARPYECAHCGKRFKAHSVYNHHLLTHSEVRAYKCPYCPKAFKTSVQLAGHKNSHTKPFSCQHCNRPFASLYAVRIHTETHLRQNNLKFSCSLCGASYARAFALKDHVKQVHKKDINCENVGQLDDEWMLKDATENIKEQSLIEKDIPEEVIGF